MKNMFPQFARNIEINPSNNVLDILVKLNGKYNNVIMVVGSDRVREFENLLKRYMMLSQGMVIISLIT